MCKNSAIVWVLPQNKKKLCLSFLRQQLHVLASYPSAGGLFNSQKMILYATPFTSLLSSVYIFDRAGSVCDCDIRSRRLHTMFKDTASLTFAVTPCSLVRLHLLGPWAGAASWLTLGAPMPRRKL